MQELWSAVHTAVPYAVDRPKLDPSFKLVGGKVVSLGGRTMIYTRWRRGGTTYSLHQFCGKEFALNRPVARREVTPSSLPNAPCRIIIWTENHCDYALVSAADAEQVRLAHALRRSAWHVAAALR